MHERPDMSLGHHVHHLSLMPDGHLLVGQVKDKVICYRVPGRTTWGMVRDRTYRLESWFEQAHL